MVRVRRLEEVRADDRFRRPGPAAFEPFNLKTSICCRLAAGVAGFYFLDNHRSQDSGFPTDRIRGRQARAKRRRGRRTI